MIPPPAGTAAVTPPAASDDRIDSIIESGSMRIVY